MRPRLDQSRAALGVALGGALVMGIALGVVLGAVFGSAPGASAEEGGERCATARDVGRAMIVFVLMGMVVALVFNDPTSHYVCVDTPTHPTYSKATLSDWSDWDCAESNTRIEHIPMPAPPQIDRLALAAIASSARTTSDADAARRYVEQQLRERPPVPSAIWQKHGF
jgi:hypothetical protein